MLARVEKGPVAGNASIVRWELHLFKLHAATFYRIDITCSLVPERVLRSWWVSFSANLCFGITLPKRVKPSP